jgi:hypothetical protein
MNSFEEGVRLMIDHRVAAFEFIMTSTLNVDEVERRQEVATALRNKVAELAIHTSPAVFKEMDIEAAARFEGLVAEVEEAVGVVNG